MLHKKVVQYINEGLWDSFPPHHSVFSDKLALCSSQEDYQLLVRQVADAPDKEDTRVLVLPVEVLHPSLGDVAFSFVALHGQLRFLDCLWALIKKIYFIILIEQ